MVSLHNRAQEALEMGSVAENGTSEKDGGRLGLVAVLLAIVVILVSVIVTVAFLFDRPVNRGSIEIHPPPATTTPLPAASPAPLIVYVTGAVEVPGVVQVPHGSRVQDAVVAAGGATADADLRRCNMAAPLADGQHLHIPVPGESVPDTAQDGEGEGQGDWVVNINSATVEELIVLPGIGEATAAKIVAYRQEHGSFSTIHEIMNVSGIGQVKFDGFADRITVGP